MDAPHPSSPTKRRQAFTIMEMIVSFVVLMILLVLLANMVGRTSAIWSYTRSRAEQFREARDAFDTITRQLGEATLNTYLDYEDTSGQPRTTANSTSFTPKNYARQSELRFLSGPNVFGGSHAVFFQNPRGETSSTSGGGAKLLNTIGYYVELGEDSRFIPSFLPSRKRIRLMEFCEPSDALSVYKYTSGNASADDRLSRKWFTQSLNAANPPVHIVAENIIALILLPQLPTADQEAGGYNPSSLAPDYTYDSTQRVTDPNLNPRNQLPPTILVTMIAIDELSASRLDENELAGLLAEVSSRFKKSENYEADLASLEARLTELGVNYRVFSSNVILKNAKWSREQKS
jgi:uncharacterized protein (TIGR02599 family)